MNTQQMMADIGVSAVRTSPPFVLYTVSPNDILVVIGIISGLLNVAYLLWKWRREWRKGQP
jgi:hypothetical protein